MKKTKKISGQRVVRAGKRLTFFFSNADMDEIIKIVGALEKSGQLIVGTTETVKHEMKKAKM